MTADSTVSEPSAVERGSDVAESGLTGAEVTSSSTGSDTAVATGRWRIGLALALVTIGVGLLTESLPIFASSLVGLTYAVSGRLIPPPTLELDVERTIDQESPSPGSTPTVTVSVTNRGAYALPTVGIVDEPPSGVEPVDTPRVAAAIQPDETAELRYRVRAKRGTHDFGAVRVLAANAVDGERRQATYPVETTLHCEDPVDAVSVIGQTSQRAGRIGSTDGGSGVEFHAIRAYQPTDPINRVDWNRLARTGELATIDFRQERAVRVVCVVDDRQRFALVRRSGESDALTLARHAAGQLSTALLSDHNHVGLAWFGGRGHYLRPGTGRIQAARIDRVLDGAWEPSSVRSGVLKNGRHDVDRCCRELGDEAHVVLISPLLDDQPVDAAARFGAHGHDVTVVTPAVVPETPGGRLEAIRRDSRLLTLREHAIHVVDWSPDERLSVAMDRASRRWSA